MQLPLLLTGSRIASSIVIALLLLFNEFVPLAFLIATILFALGAATDFFDGRIARARNQVTPLGSLLDPLGDKLIVWLPFLYLTVTGMYPLWILLVLFTRDMVTESVRSFVVGHGVSVPGNAISRWKSLFQMCSLTLMLLLIACVDLTQATGSAEMEAFMQSVLFEQLFGLTFWLMLASAAVGIVGMVQYFVDYSSILFKKK